MYKLCKTEQSAKRQREIERVLFEMIKKKNYNDITITELCERLNMPRKTFYRYFDSKDDALYALIEHTMHEYQGFHKDNSNEKRTLKKELMQYFSFWYEHKELIDTLERNNLTTTLLEVSVRFPICDIISISKFLPDETDWARNKILRFAICGLILEMLDWYRNGFNESISDMAEISCRMISKPLFPFLSEIGIDIQ